jgi:hypothetical protein
LNPKKEDREKADSQSKRVAGGVAGHPSVMTSGAEASVGQPTLQKALLTTFEFLP